MGLHDRPPALEPVTEHNSFVPIFPPYIIRVWASGLLEKGAGSPIFRHHVSPTQKNTYMRIDKLTTTFQIALSESELVE